MVYGYYITDAAGNERFFPKGCNYCHMSTGGQHESNCPCKDLKVADRPAKIVGSYEYDDMGNFVKEL